jgi:hypothetical protein
MSRHGECSEISVLERKVADIDDVDSPATFIQAMRARGYDVAEQTMPETGGNAVQVEVAEQGLSLLFVRAKLCPEVNRGQGEHDAYWAVPSAPNKALQLTANPYAVCLLLSLVVRTPSTSGERLGQKDTKMGEIQ